MKKYLLIFIVGLLLGLTRTTFSQITSSGTGNWGDVATWIGGTVPVANDDVIIDAGHIITLDLADAGCKNLQINGTLIYGDFEARCLTINGSLTVGATGVFNSMSGTLTGDRNQTLTIYGDLIVILGGKLDMRKGVTNGMGIVTVIFAGSQNSNISLSKTVYGSSTEEFNSVIINKTGGAKVIITTGNLYMGDYATFTPVLTFTSGMVETQGTSQWVDLSTVDASIVGISNSMYINGTLGRGMSTTDPAKRTFYIGDTSGYRPIILKTSAALTSGGYLFVQSILGDADKSSTLVGDIDKVSSVRYYRVTYKMKTSPATVALDSVGISYGANDGVAAGNTNLRIAYSLDTMRTWVSAGPTDHTTSLTSEPNTIMTGPLDTALTLKDGKPIYLALARVTGTTENTLIYTPDGVEKEEGIPRSIQLSQNYPNPFNPTTTISLSIPNSSYISLKVFDVLGKEVADLVNERKEAGNYKVSFDASTLTSGVYFYKLVVNSSSPLQAYSFISMKKMLLLK